MALRATTFIALVGAQFFGQVIRAQEAMTVTLDERGNIGVEASTADRLRSLKSTDGLVIWGEDGRDQWSSLSKWRVGRPPAQRMSANLVAAATRGDVTGNQAGMAVTTQPIDQLLGAELVRAAKPGAIITPLDRGEVANPRITIRRLPNDRAPEFPTDEYVLFRGKNEIVRIPIAAGAESVAWTKVDNLPANLQAGLPAGRYLLESKASGVRTQFTVLAAEVWEKIHARTQSLTELISSESDDALRIQLLAEDLLERVDDGHPAPLVTDAFEVLSTSKRTTYLEKLYQQLKLQLVGDSAVSEATDDATDIELIDLAREFIAHGQWSQALDSLKKIPPDAPPRHRGLSALYEAVVLAESGAATGNDAESGFRSALELLGSGSPGDAFRAHYNFANFLLRRAQDRLYNHAFQAATGGRQPLLKALADWDLADRQLKEANKLAAKVGPGAASAVKVNIARQYTLLADLVAVLNSGMPLDDRFIEGEQASVMKAIAAATELIDLPAQSSDGQSSAAVAHELLAQLAYRQADYVRCLSEASAARKSYLDQGMLVGVEGIERLMGLVYMRQAVAAADNSQELRDSALQHLLLSQQLAEVLRARFPEDLVGQTRAGFLARRAYVNEKIVELYLAKGQVPEALKTVEAVKSRALTDVLMLQRHPTQISQRGPDQFDLAQFKWPENTVALEYFLGSERAWLFLVQGTNVKVFPLVDSQAKPIECRRLVAEIQTFLFEVESSAEKMRPLVVAGTPLNSAWQDQLYKFYNILIPAKARDEIATAKTLVIIPHHILHYFPFAALVTETDKKPRKPSEMPMPKFLIDQGQTITYAPSLSTWAVLRGKPHIANRVSAVAISEFASARPLPGVKQDLKNLRAAFGNMVTSVVEDSHATEDQLRAILQQPGFTFIGTHGLNIADEPLASHLLCEPGSGDGEFMAGELYESSCASDVVVLSACYSGLGDRSPLPGDDLFGLQRALLHTGAGTVVAGLWDVYDDTGVEIMNNFFAEVHAGDTVPQALADAQRKFLSARRAEGPQDFWIHPYFWAVYKSTGSDLSRVASPASSNPKK